MNKPVVLITGASQGIGEALAKVFAKEVRGVRLALVARNEANLGTVARACGKLASGGAAAVAVFGCDVSDEASVAAMTAAVTKRFGAVDVLINNAGAFAMGPFLETSVADFDRLVAVNLRSAFLVTRAFVPAMVKRKSGDVFFMSSIAGLEAYPLSAACACVLRVPGGDVVAVVERERRKTGAHHAGGGRGAGVSGGLSPDAEHGGRRDRAASAVG